MNARNHARLCGIAAALALSVLPHAHLSQAQAQKPDQDQVRPLTKAYNTSGLDLFQTLAVEPGNIVLSPYSIGTAMAMVLSGARGETQTEMAAALRHAPATGGIDAANASALAVLSAYDKPSAATCPGGFTLTDKLCAAAAPKDGECSNGARRDGEQCVAAPNMPASAATLRIANALMLVNASATVVPAFEQTIRTQYGSEIFTKADLDAVNGWVKEKTDGKIDRILERLGPNDSHVLLNAVYFKAPWEQAFTKTATRDRDFKLTAADTVSVPTMFQQSEFAIAKGEGFSSIRLPYSVNGLSMIVLRPDDVDGLDALIAKMDGKQIADVIEQTRKAKKRMASLSMPRFKTEFRADLIPPFKSAGMTKVFDPAQSDLSGLTGVSSQGAKPTIDQIVHRAVIEVAEEGTEAAAATAVVITTRTMSAGGPEQFQIDRPFMFLIAEDKTGAILFEGRIADPRK